VGCATAEAAVAQIRALCIDSLSAPRRDGELDRTLPFRQRPKGVRSRRGNGGNVSAISSSRENWIDRTPTRTYGQ
jgi:hypothetical protein